MASPAPKAALAAPGGTCPFCALPYTGAPSRCSRCGTLLGEARGDLKRAGERARKDLHFRRAQADLLFLVGLLLGGPMMGLGTNIQVGLFVVLAGGVASILRRYTPSSLAGSGVVGGLGAAVVAALVVEPVRSLVETVDVGEAARLAYVESLAGMEADLVAEARGPEAITLWLTLPDALAGECGSYPSVEVRAHLAELGFLRVVVAGRARGGGICSFPP